MAYCPKCGIKVEKGNRPCPLCGFHIPEVNETEKVASRKFPKAANPYPVHLRRVLNRIFVFVSLLVFVAISLMFYVNYELNEAFTWSKYSNLSVLAGWGLLYFSFGYVQSYYKVIFGIAVIALVLLFGLDIFHGGLDWFFPLAFPIVVGASVIGFAYWSLIRALSVKGFNVIGFFFIAVVILSMWINFFINSHQNEIDLSSWFIVTALQLLPVLSIMLYVKYGMPEHVKQKIARKFHL
ncbi:zinc ribbon domain-containing protein [Virgibacillus sp. NKC19-16]|uniref:DUF6320 domain-containing protein n=1 Tax=Virgibacillus salidurans TaxID=2831673 RepID=UPI001F23F5F2|nr:DUF6320 domain-containing protein [Virgibacillus sp. NKC19-16]UJL45624.1 zinc ribbon domain-containing protein [Virgibacillus sp. NKC19-16]